MQTFKQEKKQRGKKKGQKNTTEPDDKAIMQIFHKVKPPGHGVDSRDVHKALPAKFKKKIERTPSRGDWQRAKWIPQAFGVISNAIFKEYFNPNNIFPCFIASMLYCQFACMPC